MPACILEIGGLLVVRSEGGPFEAEYALFEAHEIELRSNKEPGTVREHGYSTTVELARERLETEGATRALGDATAGELGALVTAYALGPEVRRVAALLGACELFEGRTWNAKTKKYEGAWLDVDALAADLGLDGAARAFQHLFLASLLSEVAPEAPVYLTTSEYTAGRRPGERTHRRVSLGRVGEMPEAIRRLAEKRLARPPREKGPTRLELLEEVRGRLRACVLGSAREALEALGRALSVRERPQRGPLSEPHLWALEVELDNAAAASDVIEKLDALERSAGRQPGTAYLRARAALLVGEEDPRLIAERASSLAMSMSSFAELELVAAEAWMRAGDKKRALAYANDLAENPQVEASLRLRAKAMIQSAEDDALPAIAPATEPTARVASLSSPRASVRAPAHLRAPSDPRPFLPPPSSAPPQSESTPFVAITAGLRASLTPSVGAIESALSTHPTLRQSAPPIPPEAAQADERDTPIAPTPIFSIGSPPVSSRGSGSHRRASQSAVSAAVPIPSDAAPATHEAAPSPPADPSARAAPAPPPPPPKAWSSAPPPPPPPYPGEGGFVPPPLARSVTPAPVRAPSPAPAPNRPAPARPNDQAVVVRGGSQPPFQTQPPPPHFPSAPIIPLLEPERIEKVESLSLPPGLHGESAVMTLPTNAIEARIYFTHQARELGRLYRSRHGVELRTDLRSIELAQRYLAERFEHGELRTPDDARELRLHGAFLSELLARRLGAEWTDLAVSEMGYWAMNVPPGITVWPIGRVVRYVTMQTRERDLVSYFLELQARAHGLR